MRMPCPAEILNLEAFQLSGVLHHVVLGRHGTGLYRDDPVPASAEHDLGADLSAILERVLHHRHEDLFQTTIPDEIIESAKIDGAGEFLTFIRIVLPVSLPGIATIGLFSSLGYWNDWFNALLYYNNPQATPPLQFMLMQIEKNMDFLTKNAQNIGSFDVAAGLPTETVRMAMVVLATLPIVMAYPFFQRYFVQGLTVGSVKG